MDLTQALTIAARGMAMEPSRLQRLAGKLAQRDGRRPARAMASRRRVDPAICAANLSVMQVTRNLLVRTIEMLK